MSHDLHCVVTTIQEPTGCVHSLVKTLALHNVPLTVLGDRKGPQRFALPGSQFHSIEDQCQLTYRLARQLPENHYTRKNLGYLLAIGAGAKCIYETDDDNRPNETWAPREEWVQAQPVATRPWLNVYRLFSKELLWPRGFPLECIRDPATFAHDPAMPTLSFKAPIQQGLADLAPDVDAVWRLVFGHDFYFDKRASVYLPPGTWCPFNSQTTWWWPEAYPLLYLPSYCSFRMTDIWRSFIAQRCLWELDTGIVFHAAEAIQERNDHVLLRDFKDEISGYEQNATIAKRLSALRLSPGLSSVTGNLVACYEDLVGAGIFPTLELQLVGAWVEDLAALINV